MRKVNTTTVSRKLEDFGLSTEEAIIYQNLLSGQPKTVVNISRQTNLPRTSIYDNIERLSAKGLIENIVEENTRLVKIAPLEMLDLLVEKKRAEIENLYQQLLPLKEVLKQPTISQIMTQVKFYHGPEGLRQMMWNALSAKGETYGYSEFGRVEIVGKHFMAKWNEEFHLRHLRDRAIANPRPDVFSYIKTFVRPGIHQLTLDNIRILPEKKVYITGDTTIYNNTYAVCYWKRGEVAGFEIQNQEFVKSQTTMFEFFWKEAVPLTKFAGWKNHLALSQSG